MSKKNSYVVAVVAVLAAVLLWVRLANRMRAGVRSAEPAVAPLVETRSLMGTLATVTIIHEDGNLARKGMNAAFEEMDRLAALWNKYNLASEIGKLNEAGTQQVKVSPETVEVLVKSLHFSEISGGAFDVTVEPLLKLWKKCASENRMPTDAEIAEARSRVGYKNLHADNPASTQPKSTDTPARADQPCAVINFKQTGMAVDLGAIAKGFAADLTAHKLESMGIRSALIDIGGDVRALGGKLGSGDWVVAVRDPRKQDEFVTKLRANGNAITTSGDYERFLAIEDRKINHIIDPRTGKSADQCRSVTIIAPNGAGADALATAVFVLGPKEGMKLVESLPDVETLIIDSQGRITRSSGFAVFEVK